MTAAELFIYSYSEHTYMYLYQPLNEYEMLVLFFGKTFFRVACHLLIYAFHLQLYVYLVDVVKVAKYTHMHSCSGVALRTQIVHVMYV